MKLTFLRKWKFSATNLIKPYPADKVAYGKIPVTTSVSNYMYVTLNFMFNGASYLTQASRIVPPSSNSHWSDPPTQAKKMLKSDSAYQSLKVPPEDAASY